MSREGITARRLISGGILAGLGFVALLKTILFEQILQLHTILSGKFFPDTIEKIGANFYWSGIFSLLALTALVGGIGLIGAVLRAEPRAAGWTSTLWGAALLGAGAFLFVEGILAHHVFEIHHVIERAEGGMQLLFDLAILAVGVACALGGSKLIRQDGHAGNFSVIGRGPVRGLGV